MSMWYAAAVVLTLKETVLPALTLCSVAKPWIVGSPSPGTSHWLDGDPGSAFSQTIGVDVQPEAPPAVLPAFRPTTAETSVRSARTCRILRRLAAPDWAVTRVSDIRMMGHLAHRKPDIRKTSVHLVEGPDRGKRLRRAPLREPGARH